MRSRIGVAWRRQVASAWVAIAAAAAPLVVVVGLGAATDACTTLGSAPQAPQLDRKALAVLVEKVVHQTLDPKQGGATVDVRSGRMVGVGQKFVAVSRAGGIALPAVAPLSRLENELTRFVTAKAELGEPNHYLGTWQDVKEKLVYYDVTVLFPYTDDASRGEALGLANSFGAQQGQKTIFDLGKGKTYAVEPGKAGGELTEY